MIEEVKPKIRFLWTTQTEPRFQVLFLQLSMLEHEEIA